MSVSPRIKLLLAFRSGDTCALPDCKGNGRRLTVDAQDGDPINIGDAAHIAGEHGGTCRGQRSARYDPSMTDTERNSYQNLIYLCRNCHKRIDTLPQGEIDYPAELLRSIKAKHEAKVREAMVNAFTDVGFPELEEATAWARQINSYPVSSDYSVLEIREKINRNNLQGSEHIIAMGLGIASEVASYINNVAQDDAEFPDRLRAGFLQKYYQLWSEGLRGDDLFEGMCQFAQQGFETMQQKCAGIAVLVHLFEMCEVFEK